MVETKIPYPKKLREYLIIENVPEYKNLECFIMTMYEKTLDDETEHVAIGVGDKIQIKLEDDKYSIYYTYPGDSSDTDLYIKFLILWDS